jgi:cytosine/adenosine deaminase-related metal-dependent hydrolase
MDAAIGDFSEADILVEGTKIIAVGTDIAAEATVVDAEGMIALPGLVDAHRHLWSAMFRRAIPDADGQAYSDLANSIIPVLSEEDIAAATRLSDVAAINAGITTLLDHCHVSKSSAIVDAAIRAHRESGIRSVFSYAPPRDGPSLPQHPGDLERLLERHLTCGNALNSLRLGTRLISENFALARRLGVGITCDGVFGLPTPLRPNDSSARLLDMYRAGELGPDVTIIHGTGFSDEVLSALDDCGAALTLAPTSDSSLRGLANSTPPIQGVLDHGLVDRTGISIDIEVALSPDLFAQMRGILTIQRLLANRKWARGDAAAPPQLTARDVLTMATRGGARACGLLEKTGTLTPGKEADIVLIHAEDIMNGPLNNAVGTVVLGAGVDSVDTVIIGGRLRKWQGDLVGYDQHAIVDAARRSRDRIAQSIETWEPGRVLV